ncbi:hypothetical protein AGMMS49938_02470 [Fibrobacterales bacterium]|nr:hypothetical protein AGMMS49938_02470 [Fibrobacterales bacterium]
MENSECNIKFNKSAFKHGLSESDILWAFQTFIFEDTLKNEENKYLLIGFDTRANPIEVMYNKIDSDSIQP